MDLVDVDGANVVPAGPTEATQSAISSGAAEASKWSLTCLLGAGFFATMVSLGRKAAWSWGI